MTYRYFQYEIRIDGVHGFCIALPGHGTCQAMGLAPWERAGFILWLTSWGDDHW